MNFWLHHTTHCTENIVSVCLRMDPASAEEVGSLAGCCAHCSCYRLGCERVMVGTCTRLTNSQCGYINGLRKHYSHLVGGSFLAGKAVLLAKNADYTH